MRRLVRRIVVAVLGAGGIIGLPGLLESIGIGADQATTITEGAVTLVVALVVLLVGELTGRQDERGEAADG